MTNETGKINANKGNVSWDVRAGIKTTIDIFGVIGDPPEYDGVTPRMIAEALSNSGGVNEIEIRINSPGGNVFDGVTIYNLLRAQGSKITVTVEGLAASAASIIAMAGDEIVMRDGALMMIHRASGMAYGNAQAMADMKATLEKIDEEMASIYARRSGKDASEMMSLMVSETWLDGEETVSIGLATASDKSEFMIAACADECFAAKHFSNIPEKASIYFKGFAGDPASKESGQQTRAMEVDDMDINALTLEELRAARPDLLESVEESARASAKTDVDSARNEERARAAAIVAAGNAYKQDALAHELLSGEKHATDAIAEIKDAALNAFMASDPGSPGVKADEDPSPSSDQRGISNSKLAARANEIAKTRNCNYAEALIIAQKEG